VAATRALNFERAAEWPSRVPCQGRQERMGSTHDRRLHRVPWRQHEPETSQNVACDI